MSDSLTGLRRHITDIGRLMFERGLTDSAGGNISARLGDRICITPRYAGSKHHWNLRPEQVMVCDLDGVPLEGEGQISRESKVHFRIYQDFPDAQAVVHCHAPHALVFASACQPIVPVLEANLKFGVIEVARFAPSHSNDLAEFVAEVLRGQDDRIRKYAAGALAAYHGLFAAGKDLDAAFDAAERIDTNARIILLSRLLPGADAGTVEAMRLNLEEAAQRDA